MNEELKVPTMQVPPIKRVCMTIGQLPASYVETMSYYEMLVWFVNYLRDDIIPVVNANGLATKELQELFVELQSYVNTYFDNLDVQEEINNKLDAMVEDGTLQEIITDYLNSKAIFCFDNVASLKSSTNLIDGSYAKTLGYYNPKDEGQGLYKIRTRELADVIDEGSLIAIGDDLVAVLIPEHYITIYQFGAKGDGTTDDSTSIQNAIDYSIANNFIEVKGNITRTSAITETIKLHAYNKISDLNLDVKTNSLTNDYMISVNSDNVSSWDISYPNATRGIVKNILLNNTTTISGVNGIFNAGNTRFENIQTYKLNKSFVNVGSYLDVVKIYNIQISGKIGSDYAIDLGYLGDACEIDTAHIYDTTGDKKFMTGFSGHNGITLKNLIANGDMNINGGNVNITNIHSEEGKITITNAIVDISNGFFYHNDPNITIDNSYVKLSQLEFAYYNKRFDYSTSNDIDINISNSNVEINECYKTTKDTDINEKITSFVKTNLDSQPSYNPNKTYYRNNATKINSVKTSINNENRSAGTAQLSEKVTWKLASGTYYYKAIPMVDFERSIRTYLYDGNANIALTQNDKGFRFINANGGIWRVYRGTTDGSYNSYVDIAICGGSIQDDGIMCNGYKWQSRTAGAIDTFMSLGPGAVEYVEKNIRCTKNSLPTSGTWTKGDIIYKETVGDDDPIGWICVTSGTPGTWKTL